MCIYIRTRLFFNAGMFKFHQSAVHSLVLLLSLSNRIKTFSAAYVLINLCIS